MRLMRFLLPLAILLLALVAPVSAQDNPPMARGAACPAGQECPMHPQCPAGQECPMRGEGCPAGQECPMQGDPAAMRARHQAMMQQHEMAAARIQELQDRMHSAAGEAKVAAIEALLDEILAQQRAMHEMMMGMHHPMGMDAD